MLSDRLKLLRNNAKLSQQQLADILGIDRSTYTYYETNKTNPSIPLLLKLSGIYGITVDELVGNQNTLRLNDSEGDFSDNPEPDGGEAAEISEKVLRLSDLNDEEKMLILKYRLLEDKSEIMKYLE